MIQSQHREDGRQGGADRRRAVRVPARAVAVIATSRGTVDNLSQTGALLRLPLQPLRGAEVELELHLDDDIGRVQGRAVRVVQDGHHVRLAVKFDHVDSTMQATIARTIDAAISASRRRPVLVIDDHADRRARVIERLSRCGMTPVAPRTPLEAIDALARTRLHLDVCMLAPGFGVSRAALATAVTDSFPWVTTTEITDDLDRTVERAVLAWSRSPIAVALG